MIEEIDKRIENQDKIRDGFYNGDRNGPYLCSGNLLMEK